MMLLIQRVVRRKQIWTSQTGILITPSVAEWWVYSVGYQRSLGSVLPSTCGERNSNKVWGLVPLLRDPWTRVILQFRHALKARWVLAGQYSSFENWLKLFKKNRMLTKPCQVEWYIHINGSEYFHAACWKSLHSEKRLIWSMWKS